MSEITKSHRAITKTIPTPPVARSSSLMTTGCSGRRTRSWACRAATVSREIEGTEVHMRYTLEVLGRLRPSRLREYSRCELESRNEAWYEGVRHADPELSLAEATREFDEWWSRRHTRRVRARDFLCWLFQVWPEIARQI